MELFSIRIQRTFQLVSTVKQYGSIHEYYATDKTALRSILYGRIEDIVEVNS